MEISIVADCGDELLDADIDSDFRRWNKEKINKKEDEQDEWLWKNRSLDLYHVRFETNEELKKKLFFSLHWNEKQSISSNI